MQRSLRIRILLDLQAMSEHEPENRRPWSWGKPTCACRVMCCGEVETKNDFASWYRTFRSPCRTKSCKASQVPGVPPDSTDLCGSRIRGSYPTPLRVTSKDCCSGCSPNPSPNPSSSCCSTDRTATLKTYSLASSGKNRHRKSAEPPPGIVPVLFSSRNTCVTVEPNPEHCWLEICMKQNKG